MDIECGLDGFKGLVHPAHAMKDEGAAGEGTEMRGSSARVFSISASEPSLSPVRKRAVARWFQASA